MPEPKYSKYIVDYYHEGSNWSVHIFATSMEDAAARVRQLQYAKLAGEVIAEIPAHFGLVARFMCWARGLVTGGPNA